MSWPYFADDEVWCKHCKVVGMRDEFMQKLVRLREKLGFPLSINSGYRCPEHNQRVSHTGPAGPHTTGLAVDISCEGERAYRIVQAALQMGFTGIGISQRAGHARFIHLDDIDGNGSIARPRVWGY